MKPSYRILDVTDFTQIGLTRSSEPGAPPRQMMVPIEKLVVDPEYQRDVGRSGRTNIRKIVDEFRWSRFEPIVVAETGDGRFAIINGQHRAMAAKLRGMKTVPCAVVDADRAEQAAAFAAINGNITAITSIQLFHASLAAGNVESKALATVCKAAGVRICRYPVPAREMKVGDTLAAGALLQCYRQYGPQVLQLSLECVTRTGGGNQGLIRYQIVKALSAAIHGNPTALRKREVTIAAVGEFGVSDPWDEARRLSISEKRSVLDLLSQAFTHILNQKTGKAA